MHFPAMFPGLLTALLATTLVSAMPPQPPSSYSNQTGSTNSMTGGSTGALFLSNTSAYNASLEGEEIKNSCDGSWFCRHDRWFWTTGPPNMSEFRRAFRRYEPASWYAGYNSLTFHHATAIFHCTGVTEDGQPQGFYGSEIVWAFNEIYDKQVCDNCGIRYLEGADPYGSCYVKLDYCGKCVNTINVSNKYLSPNGTYIGNGAGNNTLNATAPYPPPLGYGTAELNGTDWTLNGTVTVAAVTGATPSASQLTS